MPSMWAISMAPPQARWTNVWNKGVDVILEIEVQGALISETASGPRPNWSLSSLPLSADLELRLRSRGSESDEDHRKTAGKGQGRIFRWRTTMIISCCNGEVEQAVEELRSIIKAARCTVGSPNQFAEVNRVMMLEPTMSDLLKTISEPVFAGEHCRKAGPGHCRRR